MWLADLHYLLDRVQNVVLEHVLEGSTLGDTEQFLDSDAIGTGERGQPLDPGIICGCKDGDGQRSVIEIACMSHGSLGW